MSADEKKGSQEEAAPAQTAVRDPNAGAGDDRRPGFRAWRFYDCIVHEVGDSFDELVHAAQDGLFDGIEWAEDIEEENIAKAVRAVLNVMAENHGGLKPGENAW